MSAGLERLLRSVRQSGPSAAEPWALRTPDGETLRFGPGEPTFEIHVHNRSGLRAVQSLGELAIAEAYISGDIDFRGDLVQGMELRRLVTDRAWLVKAWAHLKPLLVGRRRANPGWIAKHYDSHNVQVLALDSEFAVYTPGIYESEDDTMELGAERKLAAAYDELRLGPGRSLLDVGSGWGGFTRFSAARGAHVTGITLSRHQLEYTRTKLAEEGLDDRAEVLYQDFFAYEPGRQFDAISMMGVLEDLSDYRFVMNKLGTLLAPTGRVYFDFAASSRIYGVPSFITRYVWPGKFRMVYMPQFLRAINQSGFDIIKVQNDRINYHLWTKAVHDRWVARHDEVLEVLDEAGWRLMRLLMAGTAQVMGAPSAGDTAYRVVLARRSATPLAATSLRFTARDGASPRPVDLV
jgi:cyclopropane-fatty-acyl-phospholipid synthase